MWQGVAQFQLGSSFLGIVLYIFIHALGYLSIGILSIGILYINWTRRSESGRTMLISMCPRIAEFQLGSPSVGGITALVIVQYICRSALRFLSIGILSIEMLNINWSRRSELGPTILRC